MYSQSLVQPNKAVNLLFGVSIVLAGSCLLALSAQLTLPGLVPTTLQTIALLCIARGLSPALALSTVACYLAEGLLGAPVFSAGRSGAAMLMGPTGGYLLGMLPSVYLASRLLSCRLPAWQQYLAACVGLVPMFGLGVVQLAGHTDLSSAISVGLMPFAWIEPLKVLCFVLSLQVGRRAFSNP